MHPAVANGSYDVNRIREDFPILGMQVYGKPLIYLDNAASAQKPKAVLDRIQHAYTAEYANVHRGLHYLANAATEAYEGAREKVRGFLNAGRPEEIIFTRNATEAINLVAYTFGRERLKEGDEIVLSIMEHHSNIVPWHFLRERQGAVLKWAPVDDDGNFLMDEFEKLLDAAHQAGRAHAYVECARHHRAGEGGGEARARPRHPGADRRQPGARCISTSTCRTSAAISTSSPATSSTGRPASACSTASTSMLAAMPPFNGGGEMIREVFEDRVTYGEPPHKFEAGTPSIVQAIGLGAAIDYVDSIGKARIRAHETELVKYAHDRLREINSLRIIGTARDKGAIVSFEMKGAHPHDVATIIDRSGVAVRAGTHCVMPLLARFGVTATCRASFALYNTKAEVDRLAEALVKAQEFFA